MSEGEGKATRTFDAGTVARLGARASEYKRRAKANEAEAAEARAEVERLRRENADLKTQADSNAAAKRVRELEAAARTRDLKDRFSAAAASAGMRPEAVSDAFTLAGLDPSKELADEDLAAAVESFRGPRSYLFAPAEGQGQQQQQAPKPEPKPGPASGRAGSVPGQSTAGIDLDRAANDPAYAMRNWDRYVEATRAKLPAVE